MRSALHWLALGAIVAVCNAMIFAKQRIVDHGATVLLELAPVDPRSLMQGDYMALRYELAGRIPDTAPHQGAIVVQPDERGVARFVRIATGEPLAPGEQLVKYWRADNVRLGAESFFFQEGDAGLYAGAKFGELKGARDGSTVLIALCDAQLERLGVTPPAKAR